MVNLLTALDVPETRNVLALVSAITQLVQEGNDQMQSSSRRREPEFEWRA